MYTLGIDLHKRSSVWVLIDDAHTELWQATVAAHPDAISKALNRMPVEVRNVQVAIEPVCGWRWVTKQLAEAGINVHVAHPKKMRAIAESDQKTDRADARILANLLCSGFFPEAHRLSDDVFRLRLMLRERAFLIKLRTSVKNRLHGIATTQGLHEIVSGNPLSARGKQAILRGGDAAQAALHHLIEDLDRRIMPFDAFVQQEARRSPLATLLMSMPCVGPVTALTVISEVGDFKRFPSGKKLARFAGLVPRERSSGGKVRRSGLTNQGSRALRTTMVEAAMRVREGGVAPELYAIVARLAPVCGQKRARIALARKMLVMLHAMAMQGIPYRAPVCNSQHELERSRYSN